MNMRTIFSTATAAALLTSILALPAAGRDFPQMPESSSVRAQVTVAEAPEACLLASIEQLDFGTLAFGHAHISAMYELTSCSTGLQDYLVRATDAVSLESPATWALEMPYGENQFTVDAWSGGERVYLSHESQVANPLVAPSAVHLAHHQLFMPVEGSDGAGETFEFDIIWTAVLSE